MELENLMLLGAVGYLVWAFMQPAPPTPFKPLVDGMSNSWSYLKPIRKEVMKTMYMGGRERGSLAHAQTNNI
jgi:hypothetical protein